MTNDQKMFVRKYKYNNHNNIKFPFYIWQRVNNNKIKINKKKETDNNNNL